MAPSKIIAIVGATGNQGSSVAKVFLNLPGWNVRCVTRQPNSDKAKALGALGADLVQADLKDIDTLSRAFQGVNAIFVNTSFVEITQAALEAGKDQTTGSRIAYDEELQYAKNAAIAASKLPENANLQDMAPDKSYVTRDDGMFRSFDRACKRAIDSGDHKNDGPTTTQLAGALMGRPGFNEEKLGKNWKIFAATYPTHATIIRRGAAELRASANEPLKPDLPAGARTATKYLLISNPDYKEGLTLASKNGTETASKVNATRSMKRKADSLDIPDPLPSFMPKHKQRVSKKATLDADEDGKAAVEDVDLDKSELANGETSIDTVL